MKDLRINWNGHDIRMVPGLVVESCVGCAFQNERDIKCPRSPEGGRKYCYTLDDDDDYTDDFIWIEDTDESFASYILTRVTGDIHEDDD